MKPSMINLLTAGFFVLALLAVSAHAESANPERDVYFGTTHGHSSWSIDAFAIGNQTSGPEEGLIDPLRRTK